VEDGPARTGSLLRSQFLSPDFFLPVILPNRLSTLIIKDIKVFMIRIETNKYIPRPEYMLTLPYWCQLTILIERNKEETLRIKIEFKFGTYKPRRAPQIT